MRKYKRAYTRYDNLWKRELLFDEVSPDFIKAEATLDRVYNQFEQLMDGVENLLRADTAGGIH